MNGLAMTSNATAAALANGAVTHDDPSSRQALWREIQRLRALLAHQERALLASRQREEEARHSAFHDTLTGLPNRQAFDQRSTDALSTHQHAADGFALMYIDLDGFKAVNDRHGHAVGDELLKVISARLSHAMRSGDAVSRQGGDEFLCLLCHVTMQAHAEAIAQKLQAVVSAPCLVGAQQVQVRASIGIAFYPQDASDMPGLLRVADAAMYRAKKHQLGHAFSDLQ